MRFSRDFLKTLSALALGVFFSCAPNSPDPLYPQNRNVGALNFRDLSPTVKVAIANGSYPDSLSGWKLFWEAPVDTNGLNGIFIFSDTIPNALADAKLVSGTGELDMSGITASLLAKLSVHDTSWEIPSSFFKDKSGKPGLQGYSVRTDTAYYFSVWLRYDKDQAGRPVALRMFLGDEYPPTIPAISDSIGQTKAVLRFDRPQDKVNLFDEDFKGPLRSIEVRWWRGFGATDSVKNEVESAFLSNAYLQDTSKHQLRLELGPLAYLTNYSYRLVVTDANGLSSTTTPLTFCTRDSLFPSTPSDFADTTPAANVLLLSWSAATDTFGAGKAPLTSFPNYHIRSYTVVLNGSRVDSIDLIKEGPARFAQSASWPASGQASRFAWDGLQWTWRWPNLRPGAVYDVHLVVRDSSGNDTVSTTASDTAIKASDASCAPGYVPVEGIGALKTYCIESHEHRNKAGVLQKSVTWTQAQEQCALDAAYLCSDSQWVRACETTPSGELWNYGSLETGLFGDSLEWLQEACRLGTGDSSGLAIGDPRCISGWGVFDMPGNLAEWTRDVYHTSPGTSDRDSTLAYTGPSDLNASSNVGTIHGGTWLKLDQLDKTLPSARCRERNYPAFANLYDTLADKSTRRRPNPAGSSIGVGFRCCRSPQ